MSREGKTGSFMHDKRDVPYIARFGFLYMRTCVTITIGWGKEGRLLRRSWDMGLMDERRVHKTIEAGRKERR